MLTLLLTAIISFSLGFLVGAMWFASAALGERHNYWEHKRDE